MLKTIVAALCLVTVSPGIAFAADRGDNKTAKPAAGEIGATHNELIAYSKWLLELDAATRPALSALRDLGPAWQAAMTKRTAADAEAQFLPFLDKADGGIREAKARTAALTPFRFTQLSLSAAAGAEPEQVHGEMLRMLDQAAELLGTFRPLLKALGNRDPKASEVAAMKMLGSARTLYRAQAAMAGAFAAVTEEGDPARESLMFDQLFYRSGMRMLGTAEAMIAKRQDPALAADLARMADEMDRVIDQGLAGVDTSQAEMTKARAQAGNDSDGASVKALLDKTHAMQGLYRESFAIARQYAAAVRATSKKLTGAQPSFPLLQPLLMQLRTTRTELDAVATRQAEIIAGTR